jgi:hypothetical protein
MNAPEMPYMKAWQCIGCGRIEGQQTCIGICEDRPVRLVHAEDYEAAVARAQASFNEGEVPMRSNRPASTLRSSRDD